MAPTSSHLLEVPSGEHDGGPQPLAASTRGRKRKRHDADDQKEKAYMPHSGYQPAQEIALVRVDPVIFGSFEINPWYSSPFVLDDPGAPSSDAGQQTKVLHGVGALPRLANHSTSARLKGKATAADDSHSAASSTHRSSTGPHAGSSNNQASETTGQAERIKSQFRDAGGRFGPKKLSIAEAPASPSSSVPSPSASTPSLVQKPTNSMLSAARRPLHQPSPLKVTLRRRPSSTSRPSYDDDRGLQLKTSLDHPNPGDSLLDSPGISSAASTAPLDSPALGAAFAQSRAQYSQRDVSETEPPEAEDSAGDEERYIHEADPVGEYTGSSNVLSPEKTSRPGSSNTPRSASPPVVPLDAPLPPSPFSDLATQNCKASLPEAHPVYLAATPPTSQSTRGGVGPSPPHPSTWLARGKRGRFQRVDSDTRLEAVDTASSQPAPGIREPRGQFRATSPATAENPAAGGTPSAAQPELRLNGDSAPMNAAEGANGEAKPDIVPKLKRVGSRGGSPAIMTPPPPVKLFVCDGCFKYLTSAAAYLQHKKTCTFTHPPGKKMYQRGAHIVWEVDGASPQAKLYCQCLCLFGKLFIDHKYIFFDVEPFLFYILTEATPSFDHVLGFFSKEKVSYDGYNLACIVTFPPYQKKGYGTLLIEFSYELDRLQGVGSREGALAGTPERPLSDLGAKGYLNFWTSALVRYFRKVFEARGVPPEGMPDEAGAVPAQGATGGSPGSSRRVKGFEGEVPRPATAPPPPPHPAPAPAAATDEAPSPLPRPRRGAAAAAGKGGRTAEFELRVPLAEVAKATRLRPDDAAFALVSSGLAALDAATEGAGAGREGQRQEGGGRYEVVVTPEKVEEVARACRCKRAVIDRQYLLM